MDVMKTKKQTKLFSARNIGVVAFVIVTFTFYVSSYSNADNQSIERDKLQYAKVNFGSMDVSIEGFGNLRSKNQALITTPSVATVEEIVLKPGAVVTPESVILRLSNPELEVELMNAELELIRQSASLRLLELNHERELINEEEQLYEFEAQLEATQFKLEAEGELVGDGIVPKLTYMETQLKEKQMTKRLKLKGKRFEQLKLVNAETVNIQRELINQQQGEYDAVKRRHSMLTVKANMHGVLQELPVELGQSLTAGQPLALIGGVDEFVALVKVPQSRVGSIEVGQRAVVDTRRDMVQAEVARINPSVEDGAVTVELVLLGKLPQSTRPGLNVDAEIFINQLENISYVKRPANVRANSSATIFKLSEDGKSASTETVVFGAESGRNLQVVSGAVANETIILTDLSKYDGVSKLQIKN
ncbi:MAG: RND transporter [Rheinheimera sp.]|nr:RND transporter [Rheinheimera sp.]MBM35419.1 RND transporter [Rheinheimera sp.]|tara:strand:- start:21958 stop:23211 length:1254 start_codon:yes stop_codon:yes gene_type:complete